MATARTLRYHCGSSSCWSRSWWRWWNNCRSVHCVTSVRFARTCARWRSLWRRSGSRPVKAWTWRRLEAQASSVDPLDHTRAARTSLSASDAGAPATASQTSRLRGTRRANTARRLEPTLSRWTRWKKPTSSTISSKVTQVDIKFTATVALAYYGLTKTKCI